MKKGVESIDKRTGEGAKSERENESETPKTETLGKNGKPLTVGEELFLVHLSRHEGGIPLEDFDSDNPRKRSRSIGEELWEVHLKRMKDAEPDDDKEVPPVAQSKAPKPNRSVKSKNLKASSVWSSAGADTVYHLRNRDVLIK